MMWLLGSILTFLGLIDLETVQTCFANPQAFLWPIDWARDDLALKISWPLPSGSFKRNAPFHIPLCPPSFPISYQGRIWVFDIFFSLFFLSSVLQISKISTISVQCWFGWPKSRRWEAIGLLFYKDFSAICSESKLLVFTISPALYIVASIRGHAHSRNSLGAPTYSFLQWNCNIRWGLLFPPRLFCPLILNLSSACDFSWRLFICRVIHWGIPPWGIPSCARWSRSNIEVISCPT